MEKMLSSEIVFRCPIFKVEHAKVELRNGVIVDRWHAIRNDAVCIIAIDKNDNVLLIREYLSAYGDVRWRVPTGDVNDGETHIDGARRELREEIGFDARSLKQVLVSNFPSGWVKQTVHIFLAKDLFKSPIDSGEYEFIEVVPTPMHEALELVKNGLLHGNVAIALSKVAEGL